MSFFSHSEEEKQQMIGKAKEGFEKEIMKLLYADLPNPDQRRRIQHSWCLVDDQFIVDYHPSFQFDECRGMDSFWQVYDINEAEDLGIVNIQKTGKEFRLGKKSFIYFGLSQSFGLSPVRILAPI